MFSVSGSTFTENSAGEGSGGALGFSVGVAGATVEIGDSTFRENAARSGGAVELHASRFSTEANFEVLRCTFEGNMADSMGGAIYYSGQPPASLSVLDCDFLSNSADDEGGAIRITGDPSCTVAIDGSTFDSNAADPGSVLYGFEWDQDATASLALAGSTLTGNEGTGAIYLSWDTSIIQVASCAIEDPDSGSVLIVGGGETRITDILVGWGKRAISRPAFLTTI